MICTQKANTKDKESIFTLIIQCVEKCSGTVQQLAHNVHVFASSQREGSYIKGFLHVIQPLISLLLPAVSFKSWFTEITVRKASAASTPWAVSFGMSAVWKTVIVSCHFYLHQGYGKSNFMPTALLQGGRYSHYQFRKKETEVPGQKRTRAAWPGEAHPWFMRRLSDTEACVPSCSGVLPALLGGSSVSPPLSSVVVGLRWPQASQGEPVFQASPDFPRTSWLCNTAKVIKPLWAPSLVVRGPPRAVKHHLRFHRSSTSLGRVAQPVGGQVRGGA